MNYGYLLSSQPCEPPKMTFNGSSGNINVFSWTPLLAYQSSGWRVCHWLFMRSQQVKIRQFIILHFTCCRFYFNAAEDESGEILHLCKSDAIDLSAKVLTYNTGCISQSLKPPALLTGKSFKRERETWDVHFNPGLFNVCPLTVWARHHFNGMYSDKANKTSRWLIIWALYQYDFPVCFSAARWWGPNWIQFVRVCEQTGWGSLCTFVYECESVFPHMSVSFYYSRFILGTNTLWLSKCLCIDRLRLNRGKNYVTQRQISGGPVLKLHRHPY